MIKNRITALLLICTLILTLIPFAGASAVSANETLNLTDGKVSIIDFGNTGEIPENVFSHPVAEVTEDKCYDGKESSVKYTFGSGTADLDVVINPESRDISMFANINAKINVRFFSEAEGSKFNIIYYNTNATNKYYPNPASKRVVIDGSDEWQIFSIPFDDVYAKTGNTLSFRINDDGWNNSKNYNNGDTVFIDSIWIEQESYGSKNKTEPSSGIANGEGNQSTNLCGNNDFTLTFDEPLWQYDFYENGEKKNVSDSAKVYEYDSIQKEYIPTEQSYSVSADGNVLSVIFDYSVADETGYRIDFDSDKILFASGRKPSKDFSYEFAVGVESVIFSLIETSLENGEEGIDDFAPGYEYLFTFNHELEADADKKVAVFENGNDITGDLNIEVRGNILAVVFTNGLSRGAAYEIIVSASLSDKYELAIGDEDLKFSFSASYGLNGPSLIDGKIIIGDFGNPKKMPKPTVANPNMKTNTDVFFNGKTSSLEWTLTTGAMSEADYPLDISGIELSKLEKATINLRFYSEAVGSKINMVYRNNSTGSYYPDAARVRPEVEGGWQIFSLPYKDVYKATGESIAVRFNNTGWNNSGNFNDGDKIYIDSIWLEMSEYGTDELPAPEPGIINGSEFLPVSLEGNNDFNLTFSEHIWQYDYVENGEVINFEDGISVYEYDEESDEYFITSQEYHIEVSGKVLSVIFESALKDETNYRIVIDSDYIISYSGQKLSADGEYAFAVGTESKALIVGSTSIPDGANVNKADEYEITFNHMIDDSLYVPDYISLYSDGTKLYNSFDWSVEGNVLKLKFKNNLLLPGSKCMVKVSNKYADINGNRLIGNNEFRFTIDADDSSKDTLVIFSASNEADTAKLPAFVELTGEYSNLYASTAKFEVPKYVDLATMREVYLKNLERFDVAGMKYLNMWMYVSEGAKGAVNIVLKMDTQNNKYVLYRQLFTGKGWELVSIPLSVITSEISFDSFLLNFNGWASAGTTWDSDATICFDEVWFSKEEPKNLTVDASSFADGFDDAYISGQVLKLNLSTDLYATQNPEIILVDETGAECMDYTLTYEKDSMTFVFGKLKASTTYTLTVNGLVAKQPVLQEKTYKITFTTQNDGVYLEGVKKSDGKIVFDVNSLSESKLKFIVYAVGEDNELLKKIEKIQNVSKKTSVDVEFSIPEDTSDIKAYVLDSKNRLVSDKYASLSSGDAVFTFASKLGGNSPKIDFDSQLNINVLKIDATLSGISSAIICEVVSPDGKNVSENIVSASSNGKLIYYYVFGEDDISGAYDIKLTSGAVSQNKKVGYLSDSDRKKLVSLSAGEDITALGEFIYDNRSYMNVEIMSGKMAEDIATVIADSEDAGEYSEILAVIENSTELLGKINESAYSEIADIIRENKEILGKFGKDVIEEFEELSDSKANKVSAKLRNALPLISFTDLVEKLEEAMDNADESDNRNKGGSVGGGKKTSAGSFPVDNDIPATDSAVPFNDIESVPWAKDSIVKLYGEGIISAASDLRFRPDDSITREEFVKLIVCAFAPAGEVSDISFTDVEDDAWYKEYIQKALSLGIVNGYPDGSFGIGRNISREEMVTVIGRAVEATGNSLSSNSEIAFSDKEQISEYALSYVGAMTKLGVINGMGDGTFAPKSTATRAQAAKIIAMLTELY